MTLVCIIPTLWDPAMSVELFATMNLGARKCIGKIGDEYTCHVYADEARGNTYVTHQSLLSAKLRGTGHRDIETWQPLPISCAETLASHKPGLRELIDDVKRVRAGLERSNDCFVGGRWLKWFLPSGSGGAAILRHKMTVGIDTRPGALNYSALDSDGLLRKSYLKEMHELGLYSRTEAPVAHVGEFSVNVQRVHRAVRACDPPARVLDTRETGEKP